MAPVELLPPGRGASRGASPTPGTPLSIRTGPDREHLVEIRVAGRAPVGVLGCSVRNAAAPQDATAAPPVWQLTDGLALVSLGQR